MNILVTGVKGMVGIALRNNLSSPPPGRTERILPEDFMKGNFGFASDLLNNLKMHGKKATIMLSSSI